MSVPVPNQTVAIAEPGGLPTPDFRRWQLAITSAVNTPVDSTPVEPVSGDFLPLSTFVTGVDGIAFYGSLATGGVSLGLETLDDTATGTFQLIDTRDAYGRITGVADGTAADVPYDNATSGLASTDVQGAVDEVSQAANISIADAGGYFTGTDVEAALQELGSGGGGGGGYPEGTSFPGSPTTDDKFYRTDRQLLYFYDGTQWLTIQTLEVAVAHQSAIYPTGTAASFAWMPVRQDYGIYLLKWHITTFVGSPNSGSAYWSVALDRFTGAGVGTTIATINTSADGANSWANHDTAINAVLNSSARSLRIIGAKTGSPGTIYPLSTISYRLIG